MLNDLWSKLCCFLSSVANGNDSKKFKGDIRGPGVPSRVIHIRKLPNDIAETEVISLGLPFGDVTNLLMLKAKNQVTPLPPPGDPERGFVCPVPTCSDPTCPVRPVLYVLFRLDLTGPSCSDPSSVVPSGLLRDELGGSSSEHGELLLHRDADHQTPPGLRPVLQPQGAQD